MSLRFHLTCEETIHKGSHSYARNTARPTKESANDVDPPKDYLVDGTASVSMSGSKLRYSYKHQQWNPNTKSLYEEEYVDVFDGNQSKSYVNPASGKMNHPQATIRNATASESAMRYAIVPILYRVGPSDPKFFEELARYKVSNGPSVIRGRSCVELVELSATANHRQVLYLDLERDFALVRHMTVVDDRPLWQIDSTNKIDPVLGWMPESWEYIIKVGRGKQVLQSGRTTVKSYELVPGFDKQEFDITFPAGTLVSDQSRSPAVLYVIQEDLAKGIERPTDSVPTYEQLNRPDEGRRSRLSIALWASILALASGLLVFSLRRRIKKFRKVST
jgi:hypothetical protein